MAKLDKDWVLTRSNIRSLIYAIDAASDDETTPREIVRLLNDLESDLRKYEQVLRRNDYA